MNIKDNVKGRDVSIDLLKVILMYLVIVGHIINVGHVQELESLYQVIYWFHMPAFFLVTGYLTNLDKEATPVFVKRKFLTYIIPYFSFGILLFLCFMPNIKEFLLRMFYGGSLHWGITGPYWYICCLFVTLVFFKILRDKPIQYTAFLVVLMWIVAHYCGELITYKTPGRFASMREFFALPFGLTNLFLSSMFFFIGMIGKKLNVNKLRITPPLLAVLLTILIVGNGLFYKFDMKYVKANDAFLDILVPVVFTLSLFYASKLLARVNNDIIGGLIVSISKAGLVCIFVHMAIIAVFQKLGIVFDEFNIWAYALIIYAISWGLYLFLSQFKVLSFLFCGTTRK